MRRYLALGALALAFAASGAPADAATVTVNGAVTGTDGAGTSADGFKDDFLAGDRATLTITIDESADPAIPLGAGGGILAFALEIDGTGGAGSVLFQDCCWRLTDIDPSDGVVAFSGFLGGFTVSPSVSDGLGTDSGDRFELILSVPPAEAPAMPLATLSDFAAFVSSDALRFSGYAGLNFVPDEGNAFLQTVSFSGGDAVPLPPALVLFAFGASSFLLAKRSRAAARPFPIPRG